MQKIWYLEFRASFILYKKLLFKLVSLKLLAIYIQGRLVLSISMKSFCGGENKKIFPLFQRVLFVVF